MFPNSPLSFFKILDGVSKSLNIVKNVIPIYEKVNPLVKNVIVFTNNAFKNTHTQKKITTRSSNYSNKSKPNNPTFFLK